MRPNARPQAFWERHFALFAWLVLALAAFNLTYRLGSEIVTQWDESLYATSAWEMVTSGDWIGTTFQGALDYYNSKPPLNVWLIALMFKAFGPSLISLRIVSALSAWFTVAALVAWARRAFGADVALFAGLTLATTFGFFYTHSGRSANADALYTLLILLTVVTLWASIDRPWWRVLLGPLLAAAFLLKGMAVLMPLAIVLSVAIATRREAHRLLPIVVGMVLFLLPVGAWAVARWRLDRWSFFEPLFGTDFVAGTFTVLEGHPGTPFYYIRLLVEDHYDWLFAGVVALAAKPVARREWRALVAFWRDRGGLGTIVGAWAVLTLVIPTIVQTKLPWYLNPFYPAFALGIGWLVSRAVAGTRSAARRAAVTAVVLVIAIAAESRLIWYSFHYRDLRLSVQGLLLEERDRLNGGRVFRQEWDAGDRFVLKAIVRATEATAPQLEAFLRDSHAGDYLLSPHEVSRADLALVRSGAGHWLYVRLGA